MAHLRSSAGAVSLRSQEIVLLDFEDKERSKLLIMCKLRFLCLGAARSYERGC